MEQKKFTRVYAERKTFTKYDDNHVCLFLNEVEIPNYQPDKMGDEEPDTYLGYQYTGTEKDGGTIMPCDDISSYDDMTNAVIRTVYSQTVENSINRHQCLIANGLVDEEEKKTEYKKEFSAFSEFCEKAKSLVKDWLDN